MKIVKRVNEVKITQKLPIVCSKEYLSSLSDLFGYFLGYYKGEICFLVPFIIRKKFFFKYLEFQCETVVISENDDFSEVEFLELVIKNLKESYFVDFISQATTNSVFNHYPKMADFAPFGSYILDLSKSTDDLWKHIHSKHKNVIRRAIKNNVTIKIEHTYNHDIYNAIEYTLSKNSIFFFSEHQMKLLASRLDSNILFVGSYHNDILQSGAIIVYNQKGAYYFWGGGYENIPLGSNNLLQWEIIKSLKDLGVEKYNFVGARVGDTVDKKLKGIQLFKKRFGPKLIKGYIWRYPIVKWKYKLFYILYYIKNKKGDIVEQEKNTSHL